MAPNSCKCIIFIHKFPLPQKILKQSASTIHRLYASMSASSINY